MPKPHKVVTHLCVKLSVLAVSMSTAGILKFQSLKTIYTHAIQHFYLQISVSWQVDFQWGSCGSIFCFLCHGWQTFSWVCVAQSLVFCVMVGRLLVGFVWLNLQFSAEEIYWVLRKTNTNMSKCICPRSFLHLSNLHNYSL